MLVRVIWNHPYIFPRDIVIIRKSVLQACPNFEYNKMKKCLCGPWTILIKKAFKYQKIYKD